MTIGDRIKTRRIELNISQTELAAKIGIRKQTMHKYESNIITNIPSDKIEKIAQVLDTSPAYLFGWIGSGMTQENADLIPDILSDSELLSHIKKILRLNKEHRHTIYDNIDYLYDKEGHC